MRKLGKTQQAVLQCLKRHGRWHEHCGWVWDNYSGTKRVLDSLAKRGLVRIETCEGFGGRIVDVYKPVSDS